MLKLITFDMWGTLIKGNPAFKQKKIELIRSYSDAQTWLPERFIEKQIGTIKYQTDSLAEGYGVQPNHMYLFAKLCASLEIPSEKLEEFYEAYQELYVNNLPKVYSAETIPYLDKICDLGYKIAVSSNTLFTSHDGMIATVDKLSAKLAEGNYFVIALTSAEKLRSKPHSSMFIQDAVYHVGDNVITDGGSVASGVPFYQINSNNKTIKDFYEHLSSLPKD